jgi:hypothetical protein
MPREYRTASSHCSVLFLSLETPHANQSERADKQVAAAECAFARSLEGKCSGPVTDNKVAAVVILEALECRF